VYLLPDVWLAVYLLPADAAGSEPVVSCAAGRIPACYRYQLMRPVVYLLSADAGWQCTCCQLVRLAVYLLPADAAGSVPIASCVAGSVPVAS
jgi:hypothetical protein